MLRMKSGLPRSLAKWVAQVAASVGATLVASLIYSAVPRPAATEAAAPRPELTSGGKFAARAVLPEAGDLMANDGLDTMPLPRLAPMPVQAASAPVAPAGAPVEGAAAIRRVAWDGAAPFAPMPERAARAVKTGRAPLRAEARRAAPLAEPAPRPVTAVAAVVAEARVEEARDEEGFVPRLLPRVLPSVLPKVVSTAKAAWTVTAAAGVSLVDRVVPQIP